MPRDVEPDAALLAAVTDAVVTVLGNAAVAAYVHGSTGLRRLRPRSDVDVLVVTSSTMDMSQRARLVKRLLEISGRRARQGPARPVELTVVVQSEVRPWRYPPMCDFQYGEWLRADFERGWTPSPELSPDLAPVLTMVLRCDAPLFGPPPADVLDHVPREDLVRGVLAGVPALADDLDTDTTNVLLTIARVWHTADTGDIVPKDVAATWVLDRLPGEHRAVMEHARAVYVGDVDEDWMPFGSAPYDAFDYARHRVQRRSHRR